MNGWKIVKYVSLGLGLILSGVATIAGEKISKEENLKALAKLVEESKK